MRIRARVLVRGAAVTLAAIAMLSTFAVVPAAAATTVTSFTPPSGPPGTLVTVTGSGFTAGTGVSSVTFHGVATTYNVADDQHLTATVPSGATTGRIVVTAPGGTGTSTTDFVVPVNPVISGFSPTTGPPGASVIITGSGFTGVNGVRFNGTSATFTFQSDAQVTTTVPSGATTGKIQLTTTSGTTTSAANFTVSSSTVPAISGFSPSSGVIGTSVTINGNHFTGVNAVRFNGTSASFAFANDGRVTATVPPGASTGRITLSTVSGTATSSSNFTVQGGGNHDRSVFLSISGRYASGRVSVDDGYSACLSNVPVVIKRFHHGDWHWVTTTSTKSDGSYKALIGGKNGGYKAKAKKITLVNGAICQGDQSATVHH